MKEHPDHFSQGQNMIPFGFLLSCKKHLTKHFICVFKLTVPHYEQIPIGIYL